MSPLLVYLWTIREVCASARYKLPLLALKPRLMRLDLKSNGLWTVGNVGLIHLRRLWSPRLVVPSVDYTRVFHVESSEYLPPTEKKSCSVNATEFCVRTKWDSPMKVNAFHHSRSNVRAEHPTNRNPKRAPHEFSFLSHQLIFSCCLSFSKPTNCKNTRTKYLVLFTSPIDQLTISYHNTYHDKVNNIPVSSSSSITGFV
eukprot:scaffold6972_cov136-Amphora_coffeaeformis.AAC.2